MLCPAPISLPRARVSTAQGVAAADRGFTLIELLIVVAVLGVLAGVAVPHFNSPVRDCEEAALLFNLTEVRTAIQRYRAQHDDSWPVLFSTQLTITTDATGLPGTRYGPYLRRGFPANPVNENPLVKEVVLMPAAPDETTGWLLSITSGDFRANVAGIAPSGKAYFDL
jgi:prepilin-type N-terminal cleavage/methylation domain-containing protein